MVIGPCLGAMTACYLLTLALAPGWFVMIQRDMLLTSLLSWGVTGVYLIAAAVTVPVGVLLGGRFPTAISATAIVFVAIGLPLTSYAPGSTLVLMGRGVSGLGAGALVGAAVAIAMRTRPQRGAAIGSVAGLCGLSLLLGFALGGPLASTLSWRLSLLAAILPLAAALTATVTTGIIAIAKAQPPQAPPHPPYGPPPTTQP